MQRNPAWRAISPPVLAQTPSEMGVLWTDYTVEHGVKYIYAMQAYNSKHLYSNKIYIKELFEKMKECQIILGGSFLFHKKASKSASTPIVQR